MTLVGHLQTTSSRQCLVGIHKGLKTFDHNNLQKEESGFPLEGELEGDDGDVRLLPSDPHLRPEVVAERPIDKMILRKFKLLHRERFFAPLFNNKTLKLKIVYN